MRDHKKSLARLKNMIGAECEKLSKLAGPHNTYASRHLRSAAALIELATEEVSEAEFYLERREKLVKNLKSINKPQRKK